MKREDALKEVRYSIIDRIDEYEGIQAEDLHNELFNNSYYIIGRYDATKWLGEEVFDIIREITEYEQSNFGEVNTDLSEPEAIVNMYTYILGEEIICNLKTPLDGELTSKMIEAIKKELR